MHANAWLFFELYQLLVLFLRMRLLTFYVESVVSQCFSEERDLLRLKFRIFVGVGWCK